MDKSKIKILFMATPEFAIPTFDALIKNDYKIIAAITAPDAPVGRKQILTPSPIKIKAEKNNISVLQPEKIKDAQWVEKIKDLNPDLIIVCAYGKIIPKEILDIPKFDSINIHPSLLPKYRGASPIQYAIMDGVNETGVTIMLMDEQMDHGSILNQQKLEISDKITCQELNEKLAHLGANLLMETLPKWLNKEIMPIEQNHDQATFTKIIKKEDGKIDWQESAIIIERKLRGLSPWPGIYTAYSGKILKIIEAEAANNDDEIAVGKVFKIGDDIAVKCGRNALKIKTLQMEGKKPIDIKSFINGYPNFINSILPS